MVRKIKPAEDAFLWTRDELTELRRRAQAMVAWLEEQPHDYNDGDPWYSCAQSVGDGWDKEAKPGDGCADENRAGGPCDCGRDYLIAKAREILGVNA